MMPHLTDYVVNFDGYPLQAYLLENIDVVGYIASTYLVMVSKGDRVLRWWNKREPQAASALPEQNGVQRERMAALKSCYVAASTYHLIVCIACTAASCVLVPAMAQSILTKSFFETLCLWDDHRIYKGYVGFAMCVTVMVKVVEQLDTFFLILRDYIVGMPAQDSQMRRVQPSHWWFHVLIALYFWHTFSIGTSCFTMIATVAMVTSAVRNAVYVRQDTAQARGNTTAAGSINITVLALDMMEWIGCSAISVYSSYMNYTNERGCMTTQANVRMALVMYVTAIALRLRELSKDAKSPTVREPKKTR
ncbi:hypothetical protein JKF63_06708 [Porcisia hertigi]|uniref:Elongation of fatty acids protein n=1 Tax=Porcisia hertigi TaxID=2761500 RepID=A0A836IZD2_9TRYP|nr:hypothetical protein JKF63_06708 [Porcisia hertigi]